MSSTRRWLRKRMGRYGRELPESLVEAVEDIDIKQPLIPLTLPSGDSCQMARCTSGLYSPYLAIHT